MCVMGLGPGVYLTVIGNWKYPDDLALRQCLLQLLQPRVRHLTAGNEQQLQVPQPGQLLQPRVRNLGVAKVQLL